jgi:uncharacterized membrane protein
MSISNFLKNVSRKYIIVFFVIIILILLIISIVSSKNTNKKDEIASASSSPPSPSLSPEETAILTKINKTIASYNLTTTENFEDVVKFNVIGDTIKNLKLYFELMFPNLDYNKVNQLLKTYNVNLTAFEIFDKHKTDEYNMGMYSMIQLVMFYTYTIIYNKNISNKIQQLSLRLLYINNLITIHLFIKSIANTINSSVSINHVINKDYLTNDNLIFYTRTNLNKNTPYNAAIEAPENDSAINMLVTTDKLYKSTFNINNLYTLYKKTESNEAYSTSVDLFHLNFVAFLMKLENANISIINNDINTLTIKLLTLPPLSTPTTMSVSSSSA